MGTAATALSVGTQTGTWDTVNTVDVTLSAGSDAVPESATDSEVLEGANFCRLGNEYLQFATVTALGGSSYRLSRLLRGRRGTDPFWGVHAIGEPFVMIQAGFFYRVVLDDTLLNAGILIKAVTDDGEQALGDVSAQTVGIFGRELIPYTVVQVAGTRDGSNNLTIVWKRRGRYQADLQDLQDIPLGEFEARWAVRVLSGTAQTVSGVTKAANAVVTITGHTFLVNDSVSFSGVLGMVELNGKVATVTAITANSITIALDTRFYSTYSSAGTARKVLRTINATSETASYLAATQTADGLTPGNPVRVAIGQYGLYGVGYAQEVVI